MRVRPHVIPGPATAVLCVSIAVALSASPSARREGVHLHIVDVDSGLPIARARLAASSAASLALLMADWQGDVTVDVPDAGRTVRISKAGYAAESVRLEPAPEIVEVKLARGASIAGRVLDPLGLPVTGRAVRVSLVNGKELRPPQSSTNDLGDYRVGGLREGTYTVVLVPSGPATPDALEHTVTVRRGDDVGGIDFATTRVTCDVRATPAAAPPNPSSGGTASIQGRVVTGSGTPLACVEVVAFRGSERAASGRTDVNGFYALRQLRAGTYPIEFKRDGFATLQWGQKASGQPGRPVAVRDREQRRNIDMALPHGGAITGTLLDEFLEPVENVTVRALVVRGDERPVAVGTASGESDDRGRYRLFGLLPGHYIVGTVASNERPNPPTSKGYPPAYYPGVTEIAAAQLIDVREEQERAWIDFARERVRVATVSGTALNSLNEPVTDRVLLVASQRSGAVIAETQSAGVIGVEGAFTIPNVPPGDYVLQATSKRPDGAAPEFGMQYVTVYDDDPMPLRIKTAPGLDVRGRLIQDGASPVDPQSFGLTVIPIDWDHTPVLSGVQMLTPADDGALFMAGVTGPRRFALTAAPRGWFLKSIRWRGRDVTDEATDFPMSGFGFSRDFEVVVSSKGAAVEGEVLDGSSPVTEFSVVLFSSNPDHWFRNSRFIKTAPGRAAGKFRIDGVADGDYFVVAIDPLDGSAEHAWEDRDFLRSLTVNARRVRLHEGDERSLTLALTHR